MSNPENEATIDRLAASLIAAKRAREISGEEMVDALCTLTDVVGVMMRDQRSAARVGAVIPAAGSQQQLVAEQERLIRELTSKIDSATQVLSKVTGLPLSDGLVRLAESAVGTISTLDTEAAKHLKRVHDMTRDVSRALGLDDNSGYDADAWAAYMASIAGQGVMAKRVQSVDLRIAEVQRETAVWKHALTTVTSIAERSLVIAGSLDKRDAKLQELLDLIGELRAIDNDAAERACNVVCGPTALAYSPGMDEQPDDEAKA